MLDIKATVYGIEEMINKSNIFWCHENAEQLEYDNQSLVINGECPVYQLYSGITKACFIFDNTDYVIKCSFEGGIATRYNDETEDYEEREIFFRDSEIYVEDPVFDECAIYEDFENNELNFLLAETKLVELKGLSKTYCVSEIIIPAEDYNFKAKERKDETIIKNADLLYKYASGPKFEWMYDVVEAYGFEKAKDFFKYAGRNYNFLHDLHCGNYGYNKNDEPKILDFGGATAVSYLNYQDDYY